MVAYKRADRGGFGRRVLSSFAMSTRQQPRTAAQLGAFSNPSPGLTRADSHGEPHRQASAIPASSRWRSPWTFRTCCGNSIHTPTRRAGFATKSPHSHRRDRRAQVGLPAGGAEAGEQLGVRRCGLTVVPPVQRTRQAGLDAEVISLFASADRLAPECYPDVRAPVRCASNPERDSTPVFTTACAAPDSRRTPSLR